MLSTTRGSRGCHITMEFNCGSLDSTCRLLVRPLYLPSMQRNTFDKPVAISGSIALLYKLNAYGNIDYALAVQNFIFCYFRLRILRMKWPRMIINLPYQYRAAECPVTIHLICLIPRYSVPLLLGLFLVVNPLFAH